MSYFGLIFYLLLILFASCRFGFGQLFDYEFKMELVTVDGIRETWWESVLLSKLLSADRFLFKNIYLGRVCNGAFSSSDIEIVEVFGGVVRFVLTRGTNQLTINLLFAEPDAVQRFFGDIRLRQHGDYSEGIKVAKLFQYWTGEWPNDDERLQVLAKSAVFYTKSLTRGWSAGQKTFNFSKLPNVSADQGVYLVLRSLTFNISPKVDLNTFVLCSSTITTHFFVVRFPNSLFADNFSASVASHAYKQIPCSADLITPEISLKIDLS